MNNTRIAVQTDNFSVGEEYQWLAGCADDGAVVTFTGKVRNHNLGDNVAALSLEHYPGMTEKALADIVTQARERWELQRVTLIHRVGSLYRMMRLCLSVSAPPIAAWHLKRLNF